MDCLVIGYHADDFENYEAMCTLAGDGSPEYQIFSKEHVAIDGRNYSWMEALSLAYNQENGTSTCFHAAEIPNLGAAYLCNFLKKHGVEAKMVSFFNAEKERIKAYLLEERPNLVAITTTFYTNILPVVPIVEFIRDINPTIRIVAGGPLVMNVVESDDPKEMQDLLTAMGADYYVYDSQGEYALVQLCKELAAGRQPTLTPNVYYLSNGKWELALRNIENNDIEVGSIDWSYEGIGELGQTVQLRTARSCAFKCSFCDYPLRAGKLTTASVKTVRDELAILVENGVKNVIFVDDTFNVPINRFKDICRMMIEEGFDLNWYSYLRCSNMKDQESFELAARSGCKGVFLGLESGDESILTLMNKKAQLESYRNGITTLNELGIITFASVIVGFPGETQHTLENTINFINETAPTFWRAQAWWCNPKSDIFKKAKALGIQGNGYSWRHNTMDSNEAARYCNDMFSRIENSTWLPLYEFDFWGIPYLLGKGMTRKQLEGLLRVNEQLIKLNTPGAQQSGEYRRKLDEFQSMVAELNMKESRFQLHQ